MSGRVQLHGVGVRFRMYREKVITLKEAVLQRFQHLKTADDFWALKAVDLDIASGESVALIGHNGSGKSTLLKVAAGVLQPTVGTVQVEGRISPMIELAAGFDPDLTGRDNVFLNGALMGYSRKQMKEKFDRIVEFSELAEFIDMPVKNYSSGMYARLGFAIAADVEPEILIIDEILAVGDEKFQAKCIERIKFIRSTGCTIIYVSHAMDSVRLLCDRVAVLHHGELVFDGAPEPAIAKYRDLQNFHPTP